MADPRWRGHRDLTPGKVHYEIESGKTIVTTDYQGPYAICLARLPKIGQSITGLGTSFKITKARVVELDGDAGRIELTIEAPTSEADLPREPIGEPTYEIEWIELQRPIEMHPKCGVLTAGRHKWNDGVKQEDAAPDTKGQLHTWDDWADLDADDYTAGEGKWTLGEYKSLRAQGVDSYVLFHPVLRRTLIYFTPPADLGANTGKRVAAPDGFIGGDYEYLGGSDRCTKQGKTYTRTTEWRGAEKWSTLIYPAA